MSIRKYTGPCELLERKEGGNKRLLDMSTVNVLRYTALALGVFVGFRTDLLNKKTAQKKREELEYERQVKLVKEAKAEWAKLHPKPADESGPINLDDPNLDLGEVLLKKIENFTSATA